MRVVAGAIFALCFAAALGCGGDGPSCGDVGNRAVEHIRAEIRDADDPAEKQAMESMLGPLKDDLVSSCEDDAWGREARECFVEAATLEAAGACAEKASPPDPS